MTNEYLNWVMQQEDEAYTLERKDDDHVRIDAPSVTGEVNIHHIEMEVVELRLTRKKDDESIFFLHFELRDIEYAKGLFEEMIGVLKKQAHHKAVRILLTCTSAMTTSFFAGKLSEGAKTLSLDYDIAAIPYPMLYEKAFDYDMILVAPQISYEYEKIKGILSDKIVLAIPPVLFAMYDTGGVLEWLQKELATTKKEKKKAEIARVMRDIDNNAKLFVITVTHDLDKTMYRYRLYDKGEVTYEGEVKKALNKIDDIYDILDVRLCRCKGDIECDAVAISMPGVMVERGRKQIGDTAETALTRVHYGEFAKELAAEYKKPFFILNNANAVALGYYAGQDKYSSITYHSQPFGSLMAGQGMVVRGHLVNGGHEMSGEIKGLFKLLMPDEIEHLHVYQPPERIGISVRNFLVANICMYDPEVVLVRSDLTPDMDRMKREIAEYIEPEQMPELIHVKDISEYAYLGTMMHGLREYKKAVARKM